MDRVSMAHEIELKEKRRKRRLTISSHCFMGAPLLRYFAVVSMLYLTSSSDRSIMWLEKRGSWCSLK